METGVMRPDRGGCPDAFRPELYKTDTTVSSCAFAAGLIMRGDNRRGWIQSSCTSRGTLTGTDHSAPADPCAETLTKAVAKSGKRRKLRAGVVPTSECADSLPTRRRQGRQKRRVCA